MQVAKHLRAVATGSILERRGTIVTLVGGMAEVKQRRLLSFAPKVVVATPGRLYDLIEAEAISLENVRNGRHLCCASRRGVGAAPAQQR